MGQHAQRPHRTHTLVFHKWHQQVGGEERSLRTEMDPLATFSHDVALFDAENRIIAGFGTKLPIGENVAYSREVCQRAVADLQRWPHSIVHLKNSFFLLTPAALKACRDCVCSRSPHAAQLSPDLPRRNAATRGTALRPPPAEHVAPRHPSPLLPGFLRRLGGVANPARDARAHRLPRREHRFFTRREPCRSPASSLLWALPAPCLKWHSRMQVANRTCRAEQRIRPAHPRGSTRPKSQRLCPSSPPAPPSGPSAGGGARRGARRRRRPVTPARRRAAAHLTSRSACG